RGRTRARRGGRSPRRAAPPPSRASSGRSRPGRAGGCEGICYSTDISFELAHSMPRGAGAAAIVTAVEGAIPARRREAEAKLPPVRELAAALGISPATAAAAYRTLRHRGFVTAHRGRGTIVAATPPVRVAGRAELPAGVVDLASGNPDPAFLP